MSNLLKVEISRCSLNGPDLFIELLNCDDWELTGLEFEDLNPLMEHKIILRFTDDFFEHYSEHLTTINVELSRLKIIDGFHQLRENDLSRETMEIFLVPQEPHFSCKMNKNGDDTIQSSGENEISQSKLQQKLAIVEKENKAMTFFEDSKCSVCLGSYKEVLHENHHIVIPSCGHPLCCECADNILMSTKKECPRCRGNITAASFNLMKFNADLQMVTQDQRVFL